MITKYICLCQAVAPVLQLACWTGILPLKPGKRKLNHLNIGCSFQLSKFWLTVSILVQLTLSAYIFYTTVMRIYFGAPDSYDAFDWYLMTICYMMIEADSLISLLGGVLHTKRIAKTLERISRLDGSLNEMKQISQQLIKILIVLSLLFSILLSSFIHAAWTRRHNFSYLSWQNILESSPGVLFRGLSCIFSQIQCAIVVMMSVLLSSKFEHLADTIKSTLDHSSFYSSDNKNKNIRKIKTSTVKWIMSESNMTQIIHLEHISDQHQEAYYCLAEVNNCFGVQLLVTFTANLFIAVYYLYRLITASDQNFLTDSLQRMHCLISLIYLFIKIFFYMHTGDKIRKAAKAPAREIQHCKLLCLPIQLQQQIQSLILQWLSVDPSYLSALNVIKIGPWLLAPIVGNAVTYLLVAIQFKINITQNPNITIAI